MKKKDFSVYLYQQDIIWDDAGANHAAVERWLGETIQEPVDLIVFPETFTTGFGDHMARTAEPMYGETWHFAQRMAERYDALFAASWIVNDDGSIYNRLHLVNPDGETVFYDKAHTFRMSSEAEQLNRGTRRPIASWRGWKIRPAVCYDLRFPTWLRNSSSLDYDLLLVCANWPGSRHRAWSTLLEARAIENLAYVVGCNRGGVDGTGIKYAGRSAIVDFRGIAMAQADDTGSPQLLRATLDAFELVRFRQHWPFNLDFDV